MSDYRHIIGAYKLELQLAPVFDERNLVAMAESINREKILPLVERVFDAQRENYVRVDSMNVELACSQEDFENDSWLETLEKEIVRSIEFEMDQRKADISGFPNISNDQEMLLFFLNHGYLPWWATRHESDKVGFSDWVVKIWNQWIDKGVTGEAENFRDSIAKRLSNYLTSEEVVLWMEKWYRVEDSRRILRALKLNDANMRVPNALSVKAAIIKIILQHYGDSSGFAREIDPLLLRFGRKSGNIKPLNDHAIQSEIKDEIKQEESTYVRDATSNFDGDSFNEEDVLKGALDSIDARGGVFISNAGVVLLANYLPQLFKTLDWVDVNRIRNVDKALRLLQYLCYGNENYEEENWPLFKILCGLPLAYVPDGRVSISLEEKTEADIFLRSVIENWSALKNTTPDGLRATFLQREGKLEMQSGNDTITLVVQKETVDILLDSLPWSFSYIRLPWMRVFLQTKWIT